MTEARYTLRVAALIAFAALALHEARYLLAHGGSGADPPGPAHAYLPLAAAAAVGLLALAAVQLLLALGRARRCGAASGRPVAGVRLWLAASAALLAVHLGQELVEGALFAGRPSGLAVLAGGGWVCAPLALGFGAVVALALRGADLAVRAAARLGRRARPARAGRVTPRPRPAAFVPRVRPLAGHLAGRAPPPAR